jgi:hypothetical protein
MNKDDLSSTYNHNKSKDTIRIPKEVSSNDNMDEWIEILRHSGLTPEELDRLAKNKLYSKIIEAIEMLSRLLVDKNMQIRLLEKENEKLNLKNESLYKANVALNEQNVETQKRLDRYNEMYQRIDDDIEVIILI